MGPTTNQPRGSAPVRRLPDIDPTQEYVSLRQEMGQSAKYVFERPLALAAIGAAMVAADRDLGIAAPTILVGLLIFNLTFTVNRVWSAARIAGYIRVALEGNLPWWGWETSLAKYRALWDDKLKCRHCAVAAGRTVPRALLWYYPIYWLHVSLVSACLLVAGWAEWHAKRDAAAWAMVGLLMALALVFAVIAVRNGPWAASRLVEVCAYRWMILLKPKPSEATPDKLCTARAPEADAPRVWWRRRTHQ